MLEYGNKAQNIITLLKMTKHISLYITKWLHDLHVTRIIAHANSFVDRYGFQNKL